MDNAEVWLVAITLLSGLPGTGKTLSAIKRFLLPSLKNDRKVYTNIEGISLLRVSLYLGKELQDMEKKMIFTEKFTTKMLINDVEKNSLVIIDEAQVYWNNRDYASEENKNLLPYLQKHRHYGVDIVFLTQNIDQLDIGIRRLCQVHYRLCRLTNVGLDKAIKVKVFPDAMGSEQFKPISVFSWWIDRSIFPLYESYASEETEEKRHFLGNIFLNNKKLLFAFGLLVLCIIFVATRENRGNIFAPAMLTKEKDFSGFNLGEYDEYFCGDKFYVLRGNGKVDTLQPKDVPPTYCPHINFNFKRNR